MQAFLHLKELGFWQHGQLFVELFVEERRYFFEQGCSFIGECDVNHPFVSLFGQARQKAFGFEPVDDAAGGAGIKIQKLADFALGRFRITSYNVCYTKLLRGRQTGG